jgi:hypothetical protein
VFASDNGNEFKWQLDSIVGMADLKRAVVQMGRSAKVDAMWRQQTGASAEQPPYHLTIGGHPW